MSFLKIDNLSVAYNGIFALRGVDIEVGLGEVVSILGPNGAGKTTLLRTISGLVQPSGGSIAFRDQSLLGLPPYAIVRKGVAHVPEGRQVFPALSVQENLEVASSLLKADARADQIKFVYDLFPELARRKKQLASTLSGGEQQMLAIGRAMTLGSDLIMVDEPSMGLAPVVVSRIFKTLREVMRQRCLTLLLVEQNAKLSLPLSDRIYILTQGRITLSGKADELMGQEEIQAMYFAGK